MAQGQDLRARIDGYLTEQVQKRGISGLTMAVVSDGRVIYSGAHGVRQLGSPEPLAPEHVFHMASVSKPFVATAVMQLAERGKLTLDDRVTKWLPYFRLADDRFREITVRHVLNHMSGMPDVENYEWDKPQFDAGAAERYIRTMAGQRLLWAGDAMAVQQHGIRRVGRSHRQGIRCQFRSIRQNEPTRAPRHGEQLVHLSRCG